MRTIHAPRDVIDLMQRWSARWPRARAVTLIDVGDADDDNVRAMNELARGAGLDLRADHCEHRPAEAVDRLGAGSYDYAHVGTSFEEMNEVERLTTLRAAERLGRQGLVWTGVLRAPLSGAGLSRSEVLKLRRRLSMGWLEKHELPRLGGGFLLAGEHRDAWTGLGKPT